MRYLGLDLGTKTLGLALSDKSGTIASFYDNLKYSDEDKLLEILKDIIIKENIELIVLGFPKNMNNTLGDRANATLEFKEKLEKNLNIDVILEDERLTTKVAEDILILGDISRNKRKKVIDGLSAVVILQAYLDKEK